MRWSAIGAAWAIACTFEDLDLSSKQCPCGDVDWRCNEWSMRCVHVRAAAPFALGEAPRAIVARARQTTVELALNGTVDDRVTVTLDALPAGLTVAPTMLSLSPELRTGSFVLSAAPDAPVGRKELSLFATAPSVTSTVVAKLSVEVVGTPGTLDERLGDQGHVNVPFPRGLTVIDAVARPDARLVVAGMTPRSTEGEEQYSCFVVQFRPDLSPDSTFGSGGVARFSVSGGCAPERIALDATGRILIAGASAGDGVLLRVGADGALDETFGAEGIARLARNVASITEGRFRGWADVALSSDGAILVVGSPFLVGRYVDRGVLDEEFGSQGLLRLGSAGPYALTALPDNKFLASGAVSTGDSSSSHVITRSFSSGDPDPSFGVDGMVAASRAARMVLQPDGKILQTWELNLARHEPDGELDTTFGQAGIALRSSDVTSVVFPQGTLARALRPVLQRDGKILIGGPGGFARYLPDGQPDLTFGENGVVATGFTRTLFFGVNQLGGLVVREDGMIVTAKAGSTELLVSRYWP